MKNKLHPDLALILHKAGANIAAIVKVFKCSRESLHAWAKKEKITLIRTSGKPEIQWQEKDENQKIIKQVQHEARRRCAEQVENLRRDW